MKQQQRECALSGAKKKQTVIWKPPESRGELWRFLRRYLDLKIPDVRVCGHHAAPMDYLWYAYERDQVCRNVGMQVYKGNGVRLAADAEFNNPLPPSEDSPLAGGELGCSMTVAGAIDLSCRQDAGTTNGDCVVWANRAGGKTQLAAVASLLEGLFKPGCQTRILSGSLVQSERMYG